MPNDDWTRGRYVKVFVSLRDDRPDIYNDDARLANWLRLLIGAALAHPSTAELPRLTPDNVVDYLVDASVIDRVGPTGYRFHGLARERAATGNRSASAAAGGRARAAQAIRDNGRFTSVASGPAGYPPGYGPTSAPTSNNAGNAGYSNGATYDDDDENDQRSFTSDAFTSEPALTLVDIGNDPHTSDSLPISRTLTSNVAGNAGRRPQLRPGIDYPCRDPEGHTGAPINVKGVGPRCPDCAAEDARADDDSGLSFRAKVARRGGWVPDTGRDVGGDDDAAS